MIQMQLVTMSLICLSQALATEALLSTERRRCQHEAAAAPASQTVLFPEAISPVRR